MNKGIAILAQNNSTTNYVQCAVVLAKSIRKTNPTLPIALITNHTVNNTCFDYVIPLPYGDVATEEWKLSNDWQIYEASPFDQTIKVEADVLMTRDISNWFDICSQQDLVIAQGCVDYKNETSTSRFYRQLFDKNQLPDLYNGITYFKKSSTAEEFFKLVRYIFEHWEDFRSTLKYCAMSEPATTDIVYSIATLCIGEEKCLLPNSVNPLKWAHMKPRIINTFSDDWTKECFFEILNSGQVRVNSYSQYYPLHYVHKHLANHFEKYYD